VRALEAHVFNGQLVLDESTTELAEGTGVPVVVLTPDFELAERERLLKSLEPVKLRVARRRRTCAPP
jgi:hypothetical protein